MFRSNFLSKVQANDLVAQHGSPLFVYSREKLEGQAQAMLGVPAPYGLTIRFAMKANPYPEILSIFRERGVKIDASSGYEARKALDVGYAAEDVLLTSQQIPSDIKDLIGQGMLYNATSLYQLETYGKAFPSGSIGVRLNPGIGSGHSAKTNVGGVTSSFGIWHEYIPQVLELAKRYDLKITRMHTHIGAGTDPAVWQEAGRISLELIKNFPDAKTINLGGGFKVARMDDEVEIDVAAVGGAIVEELSSFYKNTGRKLHLELEPGTFLVANAGILVAAVEDIVDTGSVGYTFLKLNTGMNDILRPGLYGAQHPILVLNDATETQNYVVVGHNCESGDLLTPAAGDPDVLGPRTFNKAKIGDLVLIGGCGAYCASMAAHGYNSYPSAQEVVV